MVAEYIYNGVTLAAMPDKAKEYDYRFIFGGYRLGVSNTQLHVVTDDTGNLSITGVSPAEFVCWDYESSGWGQEKTSTTLPTPESLVWTNDAVVNASDNTVYFPGSAPVPIYTVSEDLRIGFKKFMFGDTELPQMPKVNGDTHPYRIIMLNDNGSYSLYCSTEPIYHRLYENYNGTTYYIVNEFCFPKTGLGYCFGSFPQWTSWADCGECNPKIPDGTETTSASAGARLFVGITDGWYVPEDSSDSISGSFTPTEEEPEEDTPEEQEPNYYFVISGTFVWTNVDLYTENGCLITKAIEPIPVEVAKPREEIALYEQPDVIPDPISDRFVLSLPSFIEGLEYYRGTKALTWKTE